MNNCGSCGKVCLAGQNCESGKCVTPNPCLVSSFADADGDNQKNTQCGGIDCNDNNGAVWQLLSGYVDADGDGYTVGSAASVCSGLSLPSGYSATSLGTDCNDANAAINPGAVDVCGNWFS